MAHVAGSVLDVDVRCYKSIAALEPPTLLWVKDSGYAQESVRYSSGLIDFQTVLDTQRTQLRTQESVASTRIALSADHVRLYKALGGQD